jgi:amino acid adenylation domain-containing protein/non-ribosomal peptide synthase protein (TIGR01720 family)
MIRIENLLSRLKKLEIKLWVEGEHLRYQAPKGVMNESLRTEVLAHKAELLDFLLQLQRASDSALPPLLPIPREGDLPISFAQQRLWFLDQLEGPGGATYNLAAAMHLTGALNTPALEQSLGEIVRRHETLRTTIQTIDGRPVARPAVNGFQLIVLDLTAQSPEQRRVEVQRLAGDESRAPFDLAEGPLFRARLWRLGPQEHVLGLTMHHIISDGWSIGVFMRELALLYEAFSHGRPSPLADLKVQYIDFAHWQRQWLRGEALHKQLDFWKKQLAGAPALLQLPTDYRRPAVERFRGTTEPVRLSPELTERLEDLSRQAGATLFMTLLAAFAVLLSRYSGTSDIVIGSPIANRTHQHIEPLIGFFVNTLALRIDWQGNPSFEELLGQVRRVALDAYAHQDLPFERLIEELRPERNLSHTPLFQVMFMLQNAPLGEVRLADLTLTPLELENLAAKFDLTLSLHAAGPVLEGVLEYNTDLFSRATIKRMLGHFQTLLTAIVEAPRQPVRTLPLLTAAERRQWLSWNDTAVVGPPATCMQRLFEAQVERTPDAVAVEFAGRTLRYAELNARANRLAQHLRAFGVGPDVVVGLCVERSLEMMLGLIAILKAGGAYLPLDPGYPPARLAFLLEDARVGILLTQEKCIGKLPAHRAQAICLDTLDESLAQCSDENPNSAVTALNLAYVIYTSGSTGVPKGTMITHGGLGNYLIWCTHAYGVAASEGSVVHSSLGFDATVTGLLAPLLVGRKVLLLPEEQEIEALGELLSSSRQIGLIKITPAHLHALEPGLSGKTVVGQPHALIIGGEALFEESLAFWQERMPPTRLINEYGPTETVVGCCSYEITAKTAAAGPVPIGRPIANTQLYILDAALQPVPIGVPGELYIGGAGLARGYLNRPALTAERFIPDPFGAKPGARLYRTGDLARYLPDGNIDYLGRNDNQVKIRGFRIELGEIEAALVQHPAVRECAVSIVSDDQQHQRLVAYLAARTEPVATGELRSALKEKLPEYMLPAAFVWLDSLPLTPNGKVDRRALPSWDGAQRASETLFVPPRTPKEHMLSAIWKSVLGVERLGIYDNFFELGGDSILSIQVISRANQAGLRLTPRQLFQHQTIAELAAAADTRTVYSPDQGLVTGAVPLTPIQHWFFEQNLPAPHHYNQALLLEVTASLTPPLLENIVPALLRQHDALRLRFSSTGEQWLADDCSLTTVNGPLFTVEDLAGLTAEEQRRAVEATAAALQASLNLSQGPLLRITLFQSGAERPNRLLLIIHHLAVDGVSWRILLEDIGTAYGQWRRGEAIALPAKTTSFKQWAERLLDHAQSVELAAELDYWLALPYTQAPLLPVDYTSDRAANTVVSSAQVSVSLSVEQTQALLQEVPRAYNTQINDILLTALVQSFARWTGEPALLLDLEGHGREALFEDLDLSRTVGWFTSLFPVLLDLRRVADHPGEALKAVKEQLRRIPQRGIGYGLLRYLNKATAERLRTLPQAEVSFNYLGQFQQAFSEQPLLGPAQESGGPTQSPPSYRRHLLDINGFIHQGRLQLAWTYSEPLHRRSTVERLAQDFIAALQVLIAHCQSPEAGGYTPSDFPEVRLSQIQLEGILEKIVAENEPGLSHPKKNIEAIYPLSPSQQGMLIETLSAPQSGIHIEQSVLRLQGDLDVNALTRAWQRVIERHPVLRTAFIGEDLEEPLQIVLKWVRVPWQCQDWRSLPPGRQQEQLERYIDNDRSQGFELTQAPLLRLAVFQTDEQTYELVWTHHHILMDGWCTALLRQEVLRLYNAYRQGQDLWLEPRPPYGNYLAWLKRQELPAAEAFWRRLLQGFTGPTPLGRAAEPVNPPEPRYGSQPAYLDRQESAALQALVRHHRLTLNSLIQGVWALLLSGYSGAADIVFGATVSGRPADLPGVESMVGLFINTLPVRIKIAPDTPLWSWLEAIQAQQQERSPYEYCAAGQVHHWSDLPGTLPLYESIVVFENYPLDEASLPQTSEPDLEISEAYSLGAQTHYALTLLVMPGSRLGVQMVYDRARLEDSDIGRMLDHFVMLLRRILTGQDVPLAALASQIPTDQIPHLRPLPTPQVLYSAPRDHLERQLVEIWQEVLQLPAIGIQDNFFDLGGHSLLAVRLLARIGQQLGQSLPLAILLQGATIERLAALLRRQGADLPWSPLVAIQPNGTRSPFFCVPGGGGNVVYLYELARHLGSDQPFYGLQAVGLDGQSRPHTRIEDMAACYLEHLRTLQPQGPYLLGGHSFGANVAFEMSQQLQRQGQEVALLVIFDAGAPQRDQPARSPDEDAPVALAAFCQVIETWLGKPLGVTAEVLRPLQADARLDYLYERLTAAQVLPAAGDRAQLHGLVEVFITNGQIRYRPPEDNLKIPIALLRASELPEEFIDEPQRTKMQEPTWGWDPLAAEPVVVHRIPGDHITMMTEPHVQVLADRLRDCLAATLAKKCTGQGLT